MKQESVQFVDKYLLLKVDDSEEYHIVPQKGIIDFCYVLWRDRFGAIEGTKIQEAKISKDGAIKVAGNKASWQGSYDNMQKSGKLISIEGITEGEEATMHFAEETIDVTGAEEVVAKNNEKNEAIEHTFKNDKGKMTIPQRDILK